MTDTMTVAQYDERVKKMVSTSSYLCDVFVVGEISEWKPASSGHIYLTLKEGQSILKCIIWRSTAPTIRFKPAVGMKVTAFGGADFYAPGGQLNFIIRNLALFGEGEQKRALEELTNKLLKEGLFDPERKRPLPKYPKTIGVVTSETGAVIRDIIKTSRMQYPADILLAPAKVQGEGADITIVRGIELLNTIGVDVIIVGRGGGSSEDLSAFNSEALVRTIAASKAPVISAVGHETDKSLTDRVADVYASTPTQAAVLAAPSMENILTELRGLEKRIARSMESAYRGSLGRFELSNAILEANSPSKHIERMGSALEKAAMRMNNAMSQHLSNARSSFSIADATLKPSNAIKMVNEMDMRVDNQSDRLDSAMKRILSTDGQAFETICMRLEADNPHNVLKRGYSYISDENGNTITSTSSLSKGAAITVRMRDGRASARIEEVERT